jgi:hypothetical protein
MVSKTAVTNADESLAAKITTVFGRWMEVRINLWL